MSSDERLIENIVELCRCSSTAKAIPKDKAIKRFLVRYVTLVLSLYFSELSFRISSETSLIPPHFVISRMPLLSRDTNYQSFTLNNTTALRQLSIKESCVSDLLLTARTVLLQSVPSQTRTKRYDSTISQLYPLFFPWYKNSNYSTKHIPTSM